MTPHRSKKGLRFAAIDEFKRERGIDSLVQFIADDFDDSLAEDFLLRPLPLMHEALARHAYLPGADRGRRKQSAIDSRRVVG